VLNAQGFVAFVEAFEELCKGFCQGGGYFFTKAAQSIKII
jgi:hypothetical protein